MSDFNLLFVEDSPEEIKIFEDTLERYCKQREKKITFTTKSSLTEAKQALNNSFDGALVDIKLDRDGDAGNKLIDEIVKKYRIPIAIYTGNPQNVEHDIRDYLVVFVRGQVKYDAPLDFLMDIYETGLTNILGGRGTIEKALNDVFWKAIVPGIKDWQGYKQSGKETEDALLRFTVNHIIDLIDSDAEIYFPEEMYITPSDATSIKTGSIVKKKNTDQYYVVLSPACDLVKHNGQIKTDRILVSLIENPGMELIEKARTDSKIKIEKTDKKPTKMEKKAKIERAGRILSEIPRNNYSPYFHYLPKARTFGGGILNFRKLEAFKPKDYKKEFDNALIQISTAFTKDIVARFSSYYARQGQPDFDFDGLTKALTEWSK